MSCDCLRGEREINCGFGKEFEDGSRLGSGWPSPKGSIKQGYSPGSQQGDQNCGLT